ncbi:hypothetical protein PS3A_46280 [Pseudomonas sp. 3A(2025)]
MTTNTQAAAPMTVPVHYDLIKQRSPEWLSLAPAATHTTLRNASRQSLPWLEQARSRMPHIVVQLQKAYAEHRQHALRVLPIMEKLGTPESFCEPLLTAAITAKYNLPVDVRQAYFLHASHAQVDQSFQSVSKDPIVQANRALRQATRPLLSAAMQNFQNGDTATGAMDRSPALKATVFANHQILGPHITGTPLAIPAHEFATLSRHLDLGGRYQTHIDSLFSPPDDADDPAMHFKAFESSALEMQVHIALLKGLIEPADHAGLLPIVRGQWYSRPGHLPVKSNSLSLWDVELPGIVVIEIGDRVMVYIPEDPVAPLQAFASFEAFHDALRERLFRRRYMAFFNSLVPARERDRIAARLHERLYPLVKKGRWFERQWLSEEADPSASLYLTRNPMRPPLAEALYRQKLASIRDNALFHAVPSAEQDRKSHEERLAYWRDKALQALNLAAFAVPALGAVMMAVTAVQLVHEVYEGIESWTHDEREQAMGYLFDVVQNIAFMAALGAAGAHGSPIPAVESPRLVETLMPVELPSGQMRLWKPDLKPFAHDILLPATLKPNELGLYEFQGKQWLALQDRIYSVKTASNGDGLVMQHPDKQNGYEPPLRHNGAGAWLHVLDNPRQMHGLDLLRRLGYSALAFPDEMAERILKVSDTGEGVLRYTLTDLQRPPGLLADTAERFSLDQQLGVQGARETFDAAYRSGQVSPVDGVEPLQALLPVRLPRRVAEELLANATDAERVSLIKSNKLPTRLAEEARIYRQQVRLSRAYEGLYLESVHNPDTDMLILHSLEGLPGWSTEVRLEVREGHFNGTLRDSIGLKDAPTRKVLVRGEGGYEAYDAEGLHLCGRSDLYAAVLHALPDAERGALGFPKTGQKADLQRAIQAQPMLRRHLRDVLGMTVVRPAFRSPMRLADGRIGYPMSGRIRPDWAFTRDSLLDKLRLLELEDAYPDQILDRLSASGLSNQAIDERLNALLHEQQTLRASMALWADGASSIPLMDTTRLAARTHIGEAIWRHWNLNNLPEIGRNLEPLQLSSIALEDFPGQLPDFFYQRVTGLHLNGVTTYSSTAQSLGVRMLDLEVLERFLTHFSNTRVFTMRQETGSPALWSSTNLPRSIARALPGLTDLSLINQQLLLDQTQIGTFRSLRNLRNLDLSGSQFNPILPLSLEGLNLERLVLERTGLSRWPTWLDNMIPGTLRQVSLANNRLTGLPDSIMNNRTGLDGQTVIDLRGNPLSVGTVLRARLDELLPDLSLSVLVDTPPALAVNLGIQMAERNVLVEAIDAWTEASSSQMPLNEQTIAGRRRIGQALLAHWNAYARGETQTPLRLDSVDLADFPRRLPALFYTRIRALHINQARGTGEQLNDLLKRFISLTTVHLEGPMTPLLEPPVALAGLPMLTTLNLIDQGVLIDQRWIDFFARLRLLEHLELDNNRLGVIQDVSALERLNLRWLSLSNTGLDHWPQWVLDLLPEPLETLILDNNQLTVIPDELLANPRRSWGHSEISLRGNPLLHDVMQRAHTSQHYGRSYAFDIDLPQDILDITWHEIHDSDTSMSDSDSSLHTHSPATTSSEEEISVEPWLHATMANAETRRATWQQLEAGSDGQNLLGMIGYLQRSADYRMPNSRTQLIERVWRLLDVAAQDPQLLTTFNAIAEDPLRMARNEETCPDGVMLEFNQMEVMVFTRQSLLDLPTVSRGSALLSLTQRLYRLHELDRIARERAGTRDEAEVRLAYRLRWAQVLDLPVPPERMLYQVEARLRPGELDSALTQVQAGERGESFLNYATTQEPWTQYLREHYAPRFQALEQAYRDNLTQLTERFDENSLSLSSPEFEASARELQRRWLDDQQELIKTLTTEQTISQSSLTAPDAPEPPAHS